MALDCLWTNPIAQAPMRKGLNESLLNLRGGIYSMANWQTFNSMSGIRIE